jgi:hypothetical protein
MCIICLELDKLTINEAVRNLFETKSALEADHFEKVLIAISQKMIKDPVELSEKEESMYSNMIVEVMSYYN